MIHESKSFENKTGNLESMVQYFECEKRLVERDTILNAMDESLRNACLHIERYGIKELLKQKICEFGMDWKKFKKIAQLKSEFEIPDEKNMGLINLCRTVVETIAAINCSPEGTPLFVPKVDNHAHQNAIESIYMHVICKRNSDNLILTFQKIGEKIEEIIASINGGSEESALEKSKEANDLFGVLNEMLSFFLGSETVKRLQEKDINKKKLQEIEREEIDTLDQSDRDLFHTIEEICLRGELKKQVRALGVDWKKFRKVAEAEQDMLIFSKEDRRKLYIDLDPSLSINFNSLMKAYMKAYPPISGYTEYLIETSQEASKKPCNYLKNCNPHASFPYWNAFKKLKNVYKYLDDRTEMKSLNLSRETLPDLLRLTKMYDTSASLCMYKHKREISFEENSYRLREKILEKMPIKSYKVFTSTLCTERLKQEEYLKNPKNWVPKRVELQNKIRANILILSDTLSNRMCTNKTSLVAMRGNSGAGKTTIVGNIIGFQFQPLTPDLAKWELRCGTNVRNSQIHDEGSKIVFQPVFKEIKQSSRLYVLDKRLTTLDEIIEDLVEPAHLRNCKVCIKDLDVPLLTSINRMFKRAVTGIDPLQGEKIVVDGFRSIRLNRKDILEYVKQQPIIGQYCLYNLNEIVAIKSDNEIKILNQKKFNDCLHIPTDEEIEKCLTKTINAKYIRKALLRGDLKEEESGFLEKWLGITVRQALAIHNNS